MSSQVRFGVTLPASAGTSPVHVSFPLRTSRSVFHILSYVLHLSLVIFLASLACFLLGVPQAPRPSCQQQAAFSPAAVPPQPGPSLGAAAGAAVLLMSPRQPDLVARVVVPLGVTRLFSLTAFETASLSRVLSSWL